MTMEPIFFLYKLYKKICHISKEVYKVAFFTKVKYKQRQMRVEIIFLTTTRFFILNLLQQYTNIVLSFIL